MSANLVNVQGPSASYPGDPNDFSGGASANWNWNSFYDSTFNGLGGLFSGIGQLISATRGNQIVVGPNGQAIIPGQQQANNPQQPMNWTPIIAIGVVVLIIIVMIVLLVKSAK